MVLIKCILHHRNKIFDNFITLWDMYMIASAN